jgi:beta-N-acetylhexosaminidase
LLKDLVNALLQTGRPLIALAVREPYDIAHFTAASTYLAAYGFNPVSLRALVRVLFGEVNPSGKLPVTIPAADDPPGCCSPTASG